MKTTLKIIILAVIAAFATAGDKVLLASLEPLPRNVDEVAGKITPGTRIPVTDPVQRRGITGRALWIESSGYLTDEPILFRLGAEQHLAEVGFEIEQVKNDAGIGQPAYFRTRVLALEQQRAYLSEQLPKLTPAQIANRMSGARLAFDRCMEDLDEATDLAAREAGRLTRLALR